VLWFWWDARFQTKSTWVIAASGPVTDGVFHYENRGDIRIRLRFFKSKKGIALLATLVVAAVAAVGAYAYFDTGATGTGTAQTGVPTALTITQEGTISGLLPGGPAAPIDFTVNNPNAGDEGLDYVGVTVTGTSTPTCLASWFKVNQNYKAIGEIDAGTTFNSTSRLAGTRAPPSR